MAVVEGFSKETIRAFQKTVDFYYWKGIPVARAWPDWSNFKPSENQKLSMAAMAASRVAIKQITPDLRARYRALTVGRRANWLDVITGTFLSGWKNTRAYPPVLLDISFVHEPGQWVVTSKWDHSSSIYAAVLKRVYTSEAEYKEKKGGPSECVAPPFGPLVLDPDVPPEDPPAPLLIPGALEPGGYVETPLICTSSARWIHLQQSDSDAGVACGLAWEDLKNRIAASFWNVGPAGSNGTVQNRHRLKLPLPGRHYFYLHWAGALWRFLMGPWYSYDPANPPASVELRLLQQQPRPAGGVRILDVEGDFGMGAGWNTISFPFPASWWGGAYANLWVYGSENLQFCPPPDNEDYGTFLTCPVIGQYVRLYEEATETVYVHNIPDEVVDPHPDPRILFYWDYITPFSSCASVPISFPI